MRIVYMGTPLFAVYPLEKIYFENHEIVGCFTQPDKPKGRGKTLSCSPVKQKAIDLKIPVFQPEKIKEEIWVNKIRDLAPDMIIVAAYGQILSQEILDIPPHGCINIHASLLPKYRGAAPIEWSIINGEEKTGITIMYMEKGLDTGDMILKDEIIISPKDNGQSLHDKLMIMGGNLIVDAINKISKGEISREKQEDSQSSYASMLNKEMGKINFKQSATEIERLIRGLYPWPCAYTKINDKTVKIIDAQVVDKSGLPGEIIEISKGYFTVACKEGALKIISLQPEGKKIMDARAYLNGTKININQIL